VGKRKVHQETCLFTELGSHFFEGDPNLKDMSGSFWYQQASSSRGSVIKRFCTGICTSANPPTLRPLCVPPPFPKVAGTTPNPRSWHQLGRCFRKWVELRKGQERSEQVQGVSARFVPWQCSHQGKRDSSQAFAIRASAQQPMVGAGTQSGLQGAPSLQSPHPGWIRRR
jgi:hypothetical protein